MTTYSKPAVRSAWAEGAGGTDITDPGDAFVKAGWLQSLTPPARSYFNWLLNWASNGVRYFMQRGIVDFDGTETYQVGAVVQYTDGVVYRSLVSANVGNAPSSSPSQWGSMLVPTAVTNDNSTKVANTAYVATAVANEASLRTAADASTLSTAESYAAGLVSTEASARASGDSSTLTSAESYAYSVANTAAAGAIAAAASAAAAIYAPLNSPALVGTPTAPTQTAGDATTKLATTAFVKNALSPGQSLSTPGYTTLPGGLILQWGYAQGSNSNVAVTFPIPFPHAAFGAWATGNRASGGSASSNFANALTTTGCNVFFDISLDGYHSGWWFAIGY